MAHDDHGHGHAHDAGHGGAHGHGHDAGHGGAHGHDAGGHGHGHDAGGHGSGGGHGHVTHFKPAGVSPGLFVMLGAIALGVMCIKIGHRGHLALGPTGIDLDGLLSTPWIAITILCLPLLAAFTQIFIGRFLPRRGDWVSTTAVAIGLALSLMLFGRMLGIYDWQMRYEHEVDWISLFRSIPLFGPGGGQSGWAREVGFRIPMGILLDNLSVIMLVVVTLVSTLVHVFSMGYMADDPRYSRFFAYLSIFTFSMLGLILCNNLFALYVFWELVGLSSYLLIGFWFEKKSAADAQKKAFLTNRVGDIGMFLGIMTLFLFTGGKLAYDDIFQVIGSGGWAAGLAALTTAGILLFMGAVGKSAQFPMHIWLPDAMEGPTPVSALIHAATMVAAGVYMVTRMFPVFTPDALVVIAYFGGFTAIFAATIALAANDIKKVLAYSTVSQLGFMVMGLGAGAYMSGFFHLWTHAFFKACLFLGSGSVIHAVATQDMREMGGLRRKMPITFWAMFISTLAIAGVPFTSGFTSKDGILGDLLYAIHHHKVLFPLAIFGFVGAGLTAFYMFRLIFMTFFGAPRDSKKYDHAHESPWVMAAPLIILATLALVSDKGGWFQDLVGPPKSAAETVVAKAHPDKAHKVDEHATTAHKESHEAAKQPDPIDRPSEHGTVRKPNPYPWEAELEHNHDKHHAHQLAMGLSIFVAGLGILLSYLTYQRKLIDPAKVIAATGPVHRILLNKYYIDEFVNAFLVAPVMSLSRGCARFDLKVIDAIVNLWGNAVVIWSWIAGTFDNKVVDGAVNGTADVVQSAGSALSRFQTGRLKTYVAWSVAGLLILVGGFHLVTHWPDIVGHLTRK